MSNPLKRGSSSESSPDPSDPPKPGQPDTEAKTEDNMLLVDYEVDPDADTEEWVPFTSRKTEDSILAIPSTSQGTEYSISSVPFTSRSPPSVKSVKSDDSVAMAEICPALTVEIIEESMFMHLRRLYMRKQLPFNPDDAMFSPYAPMITLEQAKIVIKNVSCEWENQLQEGFDKLLKLKLKEQREEFEKFSKDQLQRNSGSAPDPSYMT